MFEIVRTSKQQTEFENTWEYICEKSGWSNDPYAKNGIRYNLLLPNDDRNKKRNVIGTIEFIPYDPKNPNSTVEGPSKSNFYIYDEVKLHQKRIWEIDKLCLHVKYQRKGHFEQFFEVFYDHAIRNNPKYYIALIEKKFFRLLRMSFGLAIEQKGEALIGPDTALIPMVFDVEKVMQDEEIVKRLLGGISSQRFNIKRQPYLQDKISQLHKKSVILLKNRNNNNSIFKKLFNK